MRRKTLQKHILLSVLLVFTVLLSACGGQSQEMKDRVAGMYGENKSITGSFNEQRAATCSNGVFVGLADGDVISYKGIPYAEPPVGERRWKPPVPAKDSNAAYEAYYYGCSPIQTEWPSEPGSYYPQSEDCLKLNVWVNKKTTRKTSRSWCFFTEAPTAGARHPIPSMTDGT